MLRTFFNGFALVAALAASTSAAAQTPDAPPLAAGRPGFTEGRGTVAPGMVQLEGGVSLGVDPSDDLAPRSVTTPGGQIRVGIGKRVELRAGGAGLQHTSVLSAGERVTTRGGSDLFVGAKVRVLDEARAGLELNVVPAVTLPTGSNGMTSTGHDPSVTVAVARALPLGFDSAAVFAVAGPTKELEHRREYAGSALLAKPLTGRATAFAEVVRVAPWQAPAVTSLNGGLAFLVNGDMQLDVQLGRDVRNGSRWTLATGIVFRRR
jgi:hypothetical protein